jgi:acyl carrier protein
MLRFLVWLWLINRVGQAETSAMKISIDHIKPTSEAQELALAQLIVQTLNLEVAAAGIDSQAPLFGEGLGLDSIDMLEIALAVSQTYGVKLRADDTNNDEIFRSLASLSQYIQQHRV